VPRGHRFSLYKRTPGAAAWTPAATYDRPDLPATLQVGPNLYAPSGDLRVTVDWFHFAAVASAADCMR
jgi:hypothetical protein